MRTMSRSRAVAHAPIAAPFPVAPPATMESPLLTMLADLQTRVRQLEERVRVLESGGARAPAIAAAPAIPSSAAHAEAEKRRILEALEKAGWNKVRAAQLAGIPRRTLYRRLEEYGVK